MASILKITKNWPENRMKRESVDLGNSEGRVQPRGLTDARKGWRGERAKRWRELLLEVRSLDSDGDSISKDVQHD